MSSDYTQAVMLLKRGQPLPIDLQSRLIQSGVDLKAVEKKHGS